MPKYSKGQKLLNLLGDSVIILKVFKKTSMTQNYLVYDSVHLKEYNMREEEFKV